MICPYFDNIAMQLFLFFSIFAIFVSLEHINMLEVRHNQK